MGRSKISLKELVSVRRMFTESIDDYLNRFRLLKSRNLVKNALKVGRLKFTDRQKSKMEINSDPLNVKEALLVEPFELIYHSIELEYSSQMAKQSVKNIKPCKRKRLIPIPDRLSALPDPILCHILSFLPTKHSAATSILSKRCNSLWLSVFTLDFVAKNSSDTETFDRVILLRDIKVPIQTLRLKCNFRFNVSDDLIPHGCNHISSLISAATQRGLETLELDMQLSPVGLVLDLASNIFNFKTLTVLKLRQVTIQNGDLTGINTSLKTLHLDDVFFRCNTDIINFLLSFPTLEELQTDVKIIDQVEKVIPQKLLIKCLPNLKKASICESETIPFFLLSKALILNIKLTFFMIKLTCSQVPTFHNLTQIELFFKYDCKRNWKWMLQMLQHCPKLQHLIIENNWLEPDVVPECLSSQLRTCLIRNCRGRTCELQFAEYVMRNSKVLRTMTINKLKKINSSGYIDDLIAKYEVLQKLSRCPRSCDLIFD
ncbi:F-box/FBD/LRR-repeat protein At3g52680-like [Vicia villosa]|uniref:F-box/FBD/LRR-repeat protein At3g52680-like n=1 Tax=Vicia villosa TaxID=3911 RepID=UPI00273AB682|nr:F-box/FBD/LRR-repeat protein At3g52680-like [Vicia villosa]